MPKFQPILDPREPKGTLVLVRTGSTLEKAWLIGASADTLLIEAKTDFDSGPVEVLYNANAGQIRGRATIIGLTCSGKYFNYFQLAPVLTGRVNQAEWRIILEAQSVTQRAA